MQFNAGREPFWRRVNVALFPVCLGLLGAGLGWRAASGILGAPEAVSQIWLGAAMMLSAFCIALYARRLIAQPARLIYDLRLPAGRGAVPAASMAVMLSAAALAPVSAGVATILWGMGVLAHFYIAALLLRELIAAPPAGRPATATLYVPFVGCIVAPLAGGALGLPFVSEALFWVSIGIWVLLTPAILRRLASKVDIPPPMRAGSFILLAPPSIGLVAYDVLYPGGPLALPLFIIACVALFALLSRARWLLAGGFAPSWGAFTFPATSFAGACLVMARHRMGDPWDILAMGALTAASVVTLAISFELCRRWVTGALTAG